jgi:hypothetical protein
MFVTIRMKLALDEAPEVPLSGVQVALYDRDENDPDDHLDSGVTDAQGEILFKFDSGRYTDAEDGPSWRLESLPDLYVVIYDAQGQRVHSTRPFFMRDALPKRFTITISRALAEENGLI